jgi:alcohol dehydrogenase YqhD (iron-dependent ADH family)
MENFIAYIPTSLHFGKGVISGLQLAINPFGKKVLLMYGKGSVLKNGSYQDTLDQLSKAGAEIIKYEGIKPNPVVEDVDAAAELGIAKKVDIIVAVGGGSVIDSAKITAICIHDKVKAWDVVKRKVIPKGAIPLISVLTLAATGTEMNSVAVLQNHKTDEKLGYGHPSMYPKHSFLDPSYTLTVPANYTAYGVVDLVAHCLEAYFGAGDASLSDRFVQSIIKEAMEYGPLLMNDLTNYDLRARIMWAATNALNGLTSYGRVSGDWAVHGLGHVLSYLFDTPHGASLSIVYPAWLKKMTERNPERIAHLGELLFNQKDADSTIVGLESFFKVLGSPVTLREIGKSEKSFEEILRVMNLNRVSGMNLKLNADDRKDILMLMA